MNEFLLLDFANVIIKKLLNLSDFELRERVSQDIYSKDLEKFNEDYEKYFDETARTNFEKLYISDIEKFNYEFYNPLSKKLI